MARWLIKSEPGDYAFDDLERDGTTRWDGIRNAAALIHLRKIQAGDELFVYHTGKERRIVGIARATSAAYPDPAEADERWAVVDIEPVMRLANPVTLAAIKADEAFADFDLVRIGRLSAMPVPAALWKRLLKMSA
jgi:predicted RNA-binding protein with PUA-like domain